MADLSYSRTNRKRSSFATKHFQGKLLTSSAAKKVSILCGMNKHVKSEMLSNRHTQTKYHNPRCACALRVNNSLNLTLVGLGGFHL